MSDPRYTVSGLCTQHPRTCVCGKVFVAPKARSRYCSDACRKANSRFGRTYGQYEPRQFGWTKS